MTPLTVYSQDTTSRFIDGIKVESGDTLYCFSEQKLINFALTAAQLEAARDSLGNYIALDSSMSDEIYFLNKVIVAKDSSAAIQSQIIENQEQIISNTEKIVKKERIRKKIYAYLLSAASGTIVFLLLGK